MRTIAALVVLLGYSRSAALAQSTAPQPLNLGGVAISGSLRTRVESWDWFQGNARNDYTFPGSIFRLSLAQSAKTYDWQVEFAAPFILGLPDDAIAPGAQGQQGFGASYFAGNRRSTNAAMLFVKQGFIRIKGLGGVDWQTLNLGRMEFIDGAEVAPKDPTLTALKRDRIAHRLIGNFGFSVVGRSFDGAQYSLNRSGWSVALFGGRPTRGVFQVDGWGEVNVNVFYGALTRQVAARMGAAEWRVFALGYQDRRDGVLKTDNRPVPARTADRERINIGTFGGHYIRTAETAAGPADALVWAAIQTGSWGKLAHRAYAYAVEGGWQPRILSALKPWLRGGYDYGSGDKNPGDSTHGAFFQVLPTPRVYARFPFFNMMNVRDVFGELVLRPSRKATVRSDVHSLRLANRNDLWYSGGGAFQPWTFGYVGRTSNGHSSLANLYDISVDYSANTHLTLSAYYGHAAGKSVMRTIYPQGKDANFGYLEMMCRF